MQKLINFSIDTTNDNTIDVEKAVYKGDTLTLTVKVFSNGVLANLTNQIVDLVLLKADGTLVEATQKTISNGVITITMTQQATLCEGKVIGTLQITESATSHLSTNTFTYVVQPSISDEVLEASKNEISSLAEVMTIIKNNNTVITNYVTNITEIAGTTESVQALANIKTYINTNLPLLISENDEAVINITNENTQNDEAIINIANLTSVNGTATTLKTGLEADIATGNTLKTNLEADITTGNTLKTNLETQNTNATNNIASLDTKNTTATTNLTNLGTENTRAETNITAMQGFGDVTQLTQNVTNLQTEVETARNGEISLDTRLDGIDTSLLGVVKKTTTNINYYVATTGLDTNDGLTSGMAFKTIAKAISMIPQVVNHTFNINVASGTYNENVSFLGFLGSGTINLIGDTILSSSRVISSITFNKCTCVITAFGFATNTTTTIDIVVGKCIGVSLRHINSINANAHAGLQVDNGFGYIFDSAISNKSVAIATFVNGNILSQNNSGSGNTIGLSAVYNGSIGKSGTQPSGTTAEQTGEGGVIR